jgi:hypothetical protein
MPRRHDVLRPAYRRCREQGEPVFVVKHKGTFLNVTQAQMNRFGIGSEMIIDHHYNDDDDCR